MRPKVRISSQGAINLVNAIITDAALEYMDIGMTDSEYDCLPRLKSYANPKSYPSPWEFFHSDWFQAISPVDASYLIKKMDAEIKEVREARRRFARTYKTVDRK